MKTLRCIAAFVLAAGAWHAAGQTAVDLTRQGKLGAGTILPAVCAVGQMFFKTDAPDGSNLYACANSGWVIMGLPALSAAAPPAACSAGNLYLRNDSANSIQQLYVCSNTNTWTMASTQSGLAANRPANCVLGQTWLATDTATMTYCAATGNPGAWSATLAGPPGPAGATGPRGPTGTTGSAGSQGPAGASGPQGPVGATGSAGPQGPSGPQGPAGATGSAGAQGPSGPQGPAGATGSAGAQGPSGPQGPAGATGSAGAQGPSGPQGPVGATGSAGAQGPSGPQGPVGASGSSGAQGPSGPQGPAGTTGSAGAQGPSGPQGPAGTTGSAGAQGPSGPQGSIGATGPQGPAGPIAGSNGQFTYNNSGTAAGGNLSQNADGSLTTAKALNPPLCTVTLSASPAFDASQCNTFSLTLGSTPVTGSTLSNAKAGQSLTFILIQDATGGRSFVWPTNLLRACTISATAGASTVLTAIYDGTNATATNCTTSDTPTLITGPTRAAPSTPASGLACWFDSTDNTLKCKDASGNVYAAPLTSTATSHQFISYIDSHGVQQKVQPADSDLSFTDNTTNNVSTSSHGFAPKLPNNSSVYLDGTGNYSAPAGGGGSATWPASLVYYPGPIFPPTTYTSVSPSGTTAYCTDVYDPYTIVVNNLATVAGTTAGKYQTIVVFDSSGNKLVDVNVSEASGNNWNKFTLGTPVTLNPGLHSWCTAWEAAANSWMTYSNFGNALNPGTSGAKVHNYTCSLGTSGSGATFTLPTNGNCATSGTRTATSMLSVGAVLVLVNP